MGTAVKTKGQVFTPSYLVKVILDYAGYLGTAVLRRHAIDNSCGDGAFLTEMVRRYCAEYLARSADKAALARELGEYIHGIELQADVHRQCLMRLDTVASEYGLTAVAWDVQCADALAANRYDGKMDFVVGNPPYVRVHNLDNHNVVRRFKFANAGMTDLYIAFFEVGLQMLAPEGRMAIITPSSWLSSKAGAALRKHIAEARQLSGLIDLEHFQPFKATAYTIISRFEGSARRTDTVDYKTFDRQLHDHGQIALRDMQIGAAFYLADERGLANLRSVTDAFTPRRAEVKNGFATLADKVFVSDGLPDEPCVIDVVKASTGKWTKCVYPYDADGKPLTLERIRQTSPATYEYLASHRDRLLDRDADKERWWLFGRTQAIGDVRRRKIAVNSLIRTAADIKLSEATPGQGVYGGLYILTSLPLSLIKSTLGSDDFTDYVATLKNYKSGGYYAFSSHDLEIYLNCNCTHTGFSLPDLVYTIVGQYKTALNAASYSEEKLQMWDLAMSGDMKKRLRKGVCSLSSTVGDEKEAEARKRHIYDTISTLANAPSQVYGARGIPDC